MSSESTKIAELQQRLEEAEKNTIMAATYGKQLLDENHELHTKLEETIKEYAIKIEELEQEKHCVTLKLEAKLQTERSLALELEQFRDQHSHQIKSAVEQATKEHAQEMNKQSKKTTELKAVIDSQQIEISQMKDRSDLLEAQLKEAQERLDMCNISIHEQSTDEATASMQSQIMTLTCEKQDLETQVSSLNAQVKTTTHKLSQAEKAVTRLEAEVEEKECQCTSYYNALEHNKEEMMELKMEIESLRLAETDPAKKGNSLFAEVEDQRQVMEKKLLSYKTNYNVVKKQYDLKTEQINKMKLQLASLLSLNSSKADTEYLNHLEESLALARTQLADSGKRCRDLEAQLSAVVNPQMDSGEGEENKETFFKGMYLESQQKLADIEQELQSARFDKVALSDRILQLQRKLRQAEVTRDASNSEAIRLRVKLEEMAIKKGEKMDRESKNLKQIVEKIPGFQPPSKQPEEMQQPPQLPAAEESMPLKEKLIDRNTLQEVEKETVKTEKESEENKDSENVAPAPEPEMKKKAKKSVRMMETVAVQECDGQVQEAHIKKEDGLAKAERKKKVLRKLEAPVVKVGNGGQANECNQQ
ncbi:protein Spindly-like [Penaeus chinensis]|uniref:protein Spindly-like n=1 Tax=Penaeus chinensis TaxID=139456 RepID=UPI001FB7201C|nr:protein Spindly-like [Penaeus chinensis]XP_047493122.1 protein Spindly-like [Penaeus chinensis]